MSRPTHTPHWLMYDPHSEPSCDLSGPICTCIVHHDNLIELARVVLGAERREALCDVLFFVERWHDD